MPLNNEQCVIVRVWTSKDNLDFPGNSVGHVSIETPTQYMSLWPVGFTDEQNEKYYESIGIKEKNLENGMQYLKQTYLKYFMEREPNWKSDYQEDYKAEKNTAPQVVICFYSLDPDMIENEFSKLKKETEGWRLIGSNLLIQTMQQATQDVKFFDKKETKTIESCASLGLKLLKGGGITKLLSNSEQSSLSSQTSLVVKPDYLPKILIPAKLKELEKHPETIQFSFNSETSIEKLKEAENKSGWCLLM